MWILDTDGDALNGKRLWLRPGKRYLFGRTKAEDGQFVVMDKTISRQHLTIEAQAVESTFYENAKVRSRILLKDLNTTLGTKVNGKPLKKGIEHELTDVVNEVQFGRHPHSFRITWFPLNFTFYFTEKEERADPYRRLHQELGPLDIRILRTYEGDYTTHVVAKKRNIPKGLQALIYGKYIASFDTFIEAIVSAANPSDVGPSPLEVDFEGSLPDPLKYLPPRSTEPTEQPDESYAPDQSRRNVFDGYTFIFWDKRQFESLLAPITDGGGKALLREIVLHKTLVEDFQRYIKDVAGEKGMGEFEDGTEGKGVVVVRCVPNNGIGHEWYADFGNQIALRLDHRLINQNEFLDAILRCNASLLRRPLEEIDVTASAVMRASASPAQSQRATQNHVPTSDPKPTIQPMNTDTADPPQRRSRTRRTMTRRFQGFEDDFNPTALPEPQMAAVEKAVNRAPSQGLSVSQASEVEPKNKRKAPPIEEDDELEALAPAAASLKRRRLADDLPSHGKGDPPHLPLVSPEPKVSARRTTSRKAKKEVDVIGLARQQKEKAEEFARSQRESVHSSVNDTDISAIRNLAIIEEIPVLRRDKAARANAYGEHGDRWDDRWNGRRNFKKFRHRGREGAVQRSRLIVPLEEVKKRDFGIGEDYWVEERDLTKKKKSKGKGRDTHEATTQSQPQNQGQTQGQKSTNRSAQSAAVEVGDSQSLFVSQEPHEVISDAEDEDPSSPIRAPTESLPSTSRSKSQHQTAPKGPDTASTERSGTNAAGTKRSAQSTLTKGGTVKKLRLEESDDSEDELRFRFRKRG